ncbi:uncharacterized protein sowahb [Chaetodon auriga]|uniref:uncharacterized protein sowahb n=1 Tax=Chaetodon auriga TaxID=39042 RepID=UPI00403310CB
MATDLSQDAVLHFIQSSGGSVKNSDLLLHFRNFIRDHADRERNREHFKKFVNSVATVQQVDGVSHVVLRKKFRRHNPGGGEGCSSGPLRPRKNTELSAENAKLSPAEKAEKRRYKPPLREVATPVPPGGTPGETFLPAAGIVLNNNINNNVETNLNLKQKRQQVISSPEASGRPSAAQVISQISEKTELKTPSLSQLPAQHHRVGFDLPPGIPPVVAAVRHHGQTSQQVPEPLRGRQACPQPGGALHQEPPLHHVQSQVAPRRIRHRPSYKSAVSCDEDEEEEEEEMVPMRPGSAGGTRPVSAPLADMERAISASSPCITHPSAPSVASSSSSSGRKLPKIFIETVKEQVLPPGNPGRTWESEVRQRGQWAEPGLDPGSVPGELTSTRRSLPLEAERFTPSPDRATEAAPHRDVHMDCRYSQTAGVQREPGQGLDQSQRLRLSSSHSSIFSPSSDAGHSSSDWQPSDSPRAPGDSYEALQARTGNARGGSKILEVLQRARGTKFESTTHHANSKVTAPWHHSTGRLLEDQEPAAPVLQWNRSTGDLYNDHEDAESSEGSISTPPLRPRSAVARRVSSQMRNRMCRSLGADLDQLLQEEGRGGGSEAARLNRLHLISSSLSLRYNLSSSSLSSCSTPPRCNSLADLDEGMERKGARRSLPTASSSTAHHEGSSRQSLVPLEPREHAWLVKGAAGAWPDIYSLFREDSSLLNKRDFISGFTVLHWIAKHGDHRVLNTLWYGVQKAGLTFDINARSACGHTPLHIAAIHGHKNIMRLLVKNFNADVRLRDTAGKKPWQYLSRTVSSDVFQLLGAPPQTAEKGEGGVGRVDLSSKPEPRRRHRRRHHFSSASSGERPLTISGTMRVKRSSSIAAFLKHKSLHRFHGHQSDSSI